MRSGFAFWVSTAPSGGNTYDAELLRGLRRLGVDVVPVPVAADEADLVAAFPRERCWLVDAIVACAAPDLVADTVEAGTAVAVLWHHFGADHPGLGAAERTRVEHRERAVVHAASAVICTSGWAARELRKRYGFGSAVVAAPGVDPAPVVAGSRARGGAAHLVAVGSLTPVKDQLSLIAALARLEGRGWRASLVGSDAADPAYASVVRRSIADAGLTERVELTGPLVGDALADAWRTADLLVHPSRSETYGLVVTEALARGIPAVVSAGTGLVEALQAGRVEGEPLAGAVIPAGRPDHLAIALARWLTDDALAQRWRAAAGRQRDRLPGWDSTAAVVREVLGVLAGPGLAGPDG